MNIYFFYYIMVLIQALLVYSSSCIHKSYKKRVLLALACIELVILMGLRDRSIGADTFTYVSALFDYSEYSFIPLIKAGTMYPYKFEFGYLWLTKICALFNMDYSVFLIVIGILIYVPTFIAINRFSPFPILSLSIYFGLGLFTYSLGIFRQFIAISILISGIDNIVNDKLINWLSVVFLASLFHLSSLIFLPFFFINKINSNKLYMFSIIIQPIFFIFGRSILVALFGAFSTYSGYVESAYDLQEGSYIMLFLYNILLIVTALYDNFFRKNQSKFITFFNNCIPVVCCIQVLAYHLGIFGRVILYYSIFIIFLIPCIIKDVFRGTSQIIVSNATSLFFITLFAYITKNDKFITPFLFFWER